MSKIKELQEIIDISDNIVFFGGAGVSTESGIPDFRSESGIFKSLEKYGDTPENLVSHSYYIDHTKEFFEYYKDTLVFKDAVITQNIDGLHQKAGSKEVLELHGSIHRNYCQICNKKYSLDYILESDGIPRCECGGIVKPDVVLYEEPLNNAVLSFAIDYIQNADTLIIGGTSLQVGSAAQMAHLFHGDHLIIVNKGKTRMEGKAELVFHESIGFVFDQIW